MEGLNERDLGVLERLNTCSKGKLCRDVERANPILVNTIVLRQVKVRLHASKSDDLLALLNCLEGPLSSLRVLVNPDNLLGKEVVLNGLAELSDAHLTLKNPLDIVLGKHFNATREADRGTRAHNRRCSRQARRSGPRRGRSGLCGSRHLYFSDWACGEHGLNQALDCRKNRCRELIGITLTETCTSRPFCQGCEGITGHCRAGRHSGSRYSSRTTGNRSASIAQNPLDGVGLGRTQSLGSVVGQISERPVCTETETWVMIKTEAIAHNGDDLSLLDRIDAQVSLELIIQVQLFG